MTTWSKRRLASMILTASIIAAGVPGCGDDDPDDTADGGDADSGKGGTGGKSGAGGRSGSGGRGGAGGRAGSNVEDAGGDEDAIDSKAADLRVTLNLLLSEHLILAAKATGAALDGRMDESSAYGALLGTNGTDLGKLVKEAFGTGAETAFNGIWSAHNGFFVDYTLGVASDDEAKKTKAVADLTGMYVPQFSDLISGATGLPKATVTDLTMEHVLQTKAIVDAQAEKDWTKAYAAIREAFGHMAMIGDPLSKAIAAKVPEKFPGVTDTKAINFRVALNGLLQEHLYLATFATGAAIGGRTDELTAAGDALSKNGTDIGAAIRGLYDAAAETKFNGIWSAHNGFFVDYTTGVATDDEAKKTKAVKDLTETYVPQFADFLNGATDLPKAALATLTTDHVLTTKAVVDAQGAEDETKAAMNDRHAGQHMQMIGDPLSAAIVEKLPAKF
jgi:hypothetical protein